MKHKLGVVIMTLLLMVLLTACGNIKMKKSSDEYSGSNYESVSEELKQMGFSNIALEEIEDLTSSGPMKDGDVESVSINGETSFASNSSFSKESEVVITYHTIKKLALPIGSDSISDMDYTELADVFTKAGFENIQTNEIYDLDPDTQEKDHIVDVLVNNNDVFSKDDKIPYDAEIIINCHLFYEKYTLTLNIDFIPNIIFDKYDVNLTVGDNKVATIEHGEDWQGEISLKSDKYKLSFTSVEDSSVKGTAEIDLDCDIEAEYKISCHSKEIDVEEQYVDRKTNLGENQTKVTCTENNYLYKDHQEVYDELKSLGFTNIVEKPVYDIVWGVTEEGSVASVSINGSREYRRGDVFDKNAEVIITYHMNEEDDPAYIEQQKKEAEEAARAATEENVEDESDAEAEVQEETDATSDDVPQKETTYYSTNDPETAKLGNSGKFAYVKRGAQYYIYYVIDFDEGLVYRFLYGQGDESGDLYTIDSGDLNNGLYITYHTSDGSGDFTDILHFHYKNSPNTLIEVHDNEETKFQATSIDETLEIKESMQFTHY